MGSRFSTSCIFCYFVVSYLSGKMKVIFAAQVAVGMAAFRDLSEYSFADYKAEFARSYLSLNTRTVSLCSTPSWLRSMLRMSCTRRVRAPGGSPSTTSQIGPKMNLPPRRGRHLLSRLTPRSSWDHARHRILAARTGERRALSVQLKTRVAVAHVGHLLQRSAWSPIT